MLWPAKMAAEKTVHMISYFVLSMWEKSAWCRLEHCISVLNTAIFNQFSTNFHKVLLKQLNIYITCSQARSTPLASLKWHLIRVLFCAGNKVTNCLTSVFITQPFSKELDGSFFLSYMFFFFGLVGGIKTGLWGDSLWREFGGN